MASGFSGRTIVAPYNIAGPHTKQVAHVEYHSFGSHTGDGAHRLSVTAGPFNGNPMTILASEVARFNSTEINPYPAPAPAPEPEP